MIKSAAIILLYLFMVTSVFADVELWCSWVEQEKDVLRGLISKYEKATGKVVTLKMVPFGAINGTYISKSKKGQGPDLIIGPSDWIGQFIVDDLIEPIDSYINDKEKNSYLSNVFNSCVYNKKLYGLPESYKVMALIYNKKLVKTPPKTTDELISIAKKFTDEKNGKYGLVYNYGRFYQHCFWVGGFGGKLIDENDTPIFDSPGQIEAMKFVKSLMKGENRIIPDYADNDIMLGLFKDGLTPFIIDGSWDTGYFIKNNMDFGVARIPMVAKTLKWPAPLVGAEIVMMSSKAKNKKEAFDVMRYITSPEFQVEMVKVGHLPSKKEVYEFKSVKTSKMFEYIDGFSSQAEVGVPMPNAPELAIGLWPNGTPMISRVFFENMDPGKSADIAQKKCDEDVKMFKNKK